MLLAPARCGRADRRENCSWYGRYLWIGIADGFWVFFMVSLLPGAHGLALSGFA